MGSVSLHLAPGLCFATAAGRLALPSSPRSSSPGRCCSSPTPCHLHRHHPGDQPDHGGDDEELLNPVHDGYVQPATFPERSRAGCLTGVVFPVCWTVHAVSQWQRPWNPISTSCASASSTTGGAGGCARGGAGGAGPWCRTGDERGRWRSCCCRCRGRQVAPVAAPAPVQEVDDRRRGRKERRRVKEERSRRRRSSQSQAGLQSLSPSSPPRSVQSSRSKIKSSKAVEK